MAISLIPSKKGDYAPTLRFKDLSKKDYLIVSKLFDTPLSGPSQFCKNTDGNWYLFKLTLHEYAEVDLDAMELKVVTDEQEVSYFDGDNEYEKNKGAGDWFQSQGTILKALNNAEVGEKLKITMYENDKGKKVYNVETISSTPATKVDEPNQDNELGLDEEIRAAKKAGSKLEDVASSIACGHDVTETQVANRWAVL